MALNFPSSPTDGQVHYDSATGNRYVYKSANTAWLYSSNTAGGASITGTSNTQVLFNFQDTIAGSGDLYFDSNTLFTNTISISNTISEVNSINFKTTSLTIGSPTLGVVQWNTDENTLDIGLANGSILQTGQETLYYVKNQTGSTITQGTVVRSSGTLGSSGRILVTPFKANGQFESKYCMGVVTSDIISGGDGYVTHFGKVRGINTAAWPDGTILYANATSDGSFASAMPTAPNNKITLAIVVHSDPSNGILFVRPTLGSQIHEDELAELGTLANGDLLIYNTNPGRFENNPQAAVNAGRLNGITANTIFAHANNSSNSSNLWANTVSGYSNNWANTVAGIANTWANTVAGYSNTWANTQYGNALAYSNSVGTGANNKAGLMANAANSSAAATYLPLAGGTITGSLVINQNLTVSGTTTYVNTQSLLIGDSVIVLNADLPSTATPTENAGIEINRGNSNSNSAIVWIESAQKWYITSNTWAGNNNWIASNADLAVLGVGANNQAGLMANAANSAATTREGYSNNWANTVAGYSNTWANTVSGYSNTWANTVAGYSNTWANTKVSSVTGTAGQIFSSGGTAPTLNLISTGVSATTYGGSTQIPAIVVDSFGRITSASNVAFSSGSMDYAYANAVGTGANNQAGLMANAANSAATTREGYSNNWANTVAGISNNWANTVSGYANTWANTKLSNTSGVSFAGNLYFPSGSLGVGTSNPRTQIEIIGPSTYSALTFNVAAGVANTRVYDIIATTSNTIGYRLVNEAYTAATTYYIINRELMNISSQIWYAGAGIEALRINNTGNVGIGTTSPTYKLDVTGTNLGSTIASQSQMIRLTTNDGNADYLEISHTRTNTAVGWTGAGPRLQQKVDATWMGYIQFGGNETLNNPGGISFGTGLRSTLNAVPEVVRFDPSGNVGIGTINPVFKLDVNGDMKANSVYGSSLGDGMLNLYSTSSSAGPNWTDAITFNTINAGKVLEIDSWGGMWTGIVPSPKPFNHSSASTTIWSYYDMSFTYPQSGFVWNTYYDSGIYRRITAGFVAAMAPDSSGAITFSTNNISAAANTTATLTPRLRIEANGNVSIGRTTATTYKLDVNGSINIASGGAIAGGFTVDSFNAGANIAAYGTWTPNPTNGNYQYVTSNGSVTIAVPTSNCAIDVLWYNGVSPGSVTFSGYQAASGGGGDSYLTTANYEYILSIRRINGVSTYVWKALQ